MLEKSLLHPNPNVFVRSIMGAVFLKLLVICIAVIIYFVLVKENRSFRAILITMALYIFYTIIEVSGAVSLNRKKDGIH